MRDYHSKRKRPDEYIDRLKKEVEFLEGVRDMLVKEAGDLENLEIELEAKHKLKHLDDYRFTYSSIGISKDKAKKLHLGQEIFILAKIEKLELEEPGIGSMSFHERDKIKALMTIKTREVLTR